MNETKTDKFKVWLLIFVLTPFVCILWVEIVLIRKERRLLLSEREENYRAYPLPRLGGVGNKTSKVESSSDHSGSDPQIIDLQTLQTDFFGPPNQKPTLENTNCYSNIGLPNQFSLIPLLSYPGSGNTWLRYLIEQATNYCTGSVYNDIRLGKNLKCEMTDYKLLNTVVVKTHNIKNVKNSNEQDSSKPPFEACIFIIRNPKHAILSLFALQLSRSHTKPLTENDFNSDLWKKSNFRQSVFNTWLNTYYDGINYCSKCPDNSGDCGENIFIIFYEQLVEEVEKRLNFGIIKKLVDFLNRNNLFDLSLGGKAVSGFRNGFLEFNERCLEENNEGSFHRKKEAGSESESNPDPNQPTTFKIEKYLSFNEKVIANRKIRELNNTFKEILGGRYTLPSEYLFDMEKFNFEVPEFVLSKQRVGT